MILEQPMVYSSSYLTTNGRRCATGVSRNSLRGLASVLVVVLTFFSGFVTEAQSTAPGDPLVRVLWLEPEFGPWKPPGSLAVRVEIAHPSFFRRDTTQRWRMAPDGGWASAVRMRVIDDTGSEVNWPFSVSAAKRDEPLEVTPLQPVRAVLFVDPSTTKVVVAAGKYRLQAVVECASGNGWRGRVVSEPVELDVRPPLPARPELAIEPLIDGPLVPGWPWGVVAQISLEQGPGIPIVGGAQEWLTNLTWSVRGPDGRETVWPLVPPVLPASSETTLWSGIRFPSAQYRLAATNTLALSPGEYTLVARLTRVTTGTTSGGLESKPLVVQVTASPPPTPDTMARRHRWVAEDALQEAVSLRNRAGWNRLSTDQRAAFTRQAAEPLVRAEGAALRWMLLQADSPGPAVILSRIYRAQSDRESARAWADTAITAEALGRTPEPDGTVTPADLPDPRLLSLRQELDALSERDPFQLLPILNLELDIQRGGPVPTNSLQQDAFFTRDPRGQWAVSARASSEYGPTGWSAMRATGPPDVRFGGDSPNSWATRFADTAGEWIELTFAQAVSASGLRVRQNFNPGAISQVDLIDVDGGLQTVFSGIDTTVYTPGGIGWFQLAFPPTAKPVERVRIALDSVRVRGWNAIDAVQLLAAPVIEVQPPRLVVVPPVPGSRDLTIADWPEGFRLERSASLNPPAWEPLAERPPVVIQLGAPAEFFRLSQTPR
jgi:hypothetical protein